MTTTAITEIESFGIETFFFRHSVLLANPVLKLFRRYIHFLTNILIPKDSCLSVLRIQQLRTVIYK